MPIQSVGPGGKRGAQVLAYDVPSPPPKHVRTLRVLLLVVGAAAILNVLLSMPSVLELEEGFGTINAALKDQQEVPRLRTCVGDLADPDRLLCPVPGGFVPEGVTEAECEYMGEVLHCGGAWAAEVLVLALFGDSAQIAVNATQLMLTVLGILMLYIPARYLYLHWSAGRGHPDTLRGIRFLARLQIAVELLKVFVIVALFSETDLFDAADFIGAFPIGALLAPVLLLLARRPDVRHHFSAFEWRRLGAPSAPAPASGGAAAGAPAWGAAAAPAAPAAPAGQPKRAAAWSLPCPRCGQPRPGSPCPHCGAP